MAEGSEPVTELVAKLGLEPDPASFAAADKMLDGVAASMAQLVASLAQVTARLDVMMMHAAKAGAFMTGMFEGAAAEASAFGVASGATAGRPVTAQGAPVPQAPSAALDPVEGAKASILAKQARDAAHSQALVDLGQNDFFGPELPPGFAKDKKNVVKEVGDEADKSAAKVGLLQRAIQATGLALAANFGVNAVKNFAHGLIQASGAIIGTSERLGISKAAVQELGFAAKIAEADIGTLETGLKFLQQNSSQAAKGSKSDAKAFKDLGISVKDVHGNLKPADALFEEVADKIAALPTDAAKTAAAMQLFGRSGAQLLPMLKQGGEGIRKLREEARALGGGLSDETIEAADELEDNITRLDFAVLSLKSSIGNVLLPVMSMFVEGISKGIAALKKIATETHYLETLAITAFTTIALYSGRAAAAVAAQWIMMAAPFIGLAVAVGVFALAIEDIYKTLTGGRGQIGLWLDEWKGAGTTDALVRNFAAGIDTLKDAFKALLALDPSKFFSAIGDAAKGAFQFFSGGDAAKRDAQVAEANGMLKSKDPKVRAAGQKRLDALANQAESAGPISRALGQNIASGVLKQEMGRGSIGANSANPNATVNNVNVVVNAQTGADPKEIARVAGKEVKSIMKQQNRHLREAHARE